MPCIYLQLDEGEEDVGAAAAADEDEDEADEIVAELRLVPEDPSQGRLTVACRPLADPPCTPRASAQSSPCLVGIRNACSVCWAAQMLKQRIIQPVLPLCFATRL